MNNFYSKFQWAATKTCLFIFLLYFCTFSSSVKASSYKPYDSEIKKIEDFISKEMNRLNIPSLSIAFYKDDFMWAKSFGYADLEHKTPAEPDTLYRLASISKPLTAIGILNLMEEGKLALDDEVQKYVLYFPQKRWPITIRQLLGHLGGISHYRNYEEEGHFKRHFTTEESVGVFKEWDLEAEPGTKYIYTTYGFNLLGAVIEGASGIPYAEYMRENVWKPLGMNSTRMDIADEIIPNRAKGYRKIETDLKNSEFVDMSSRFAGGGILSTPSDLVMLSHSLDQGKVLNPETQKMMYTSMATRSGHITQYGMGWFVDFIQGFWNVGHGGAQQGTSTHLLRVPQEKFAVAVTCNEEGQSTARYALLTSGIILGAYPYRLQTPSEDEYHRLRLTFMTGLGYYDKFNMTFAVDNEDLKAGFDYFNSLDIEAKDIRQQINDGIDLFTGAPLVKVGTYMAQKIEDHLGKERLNRLRKSCTIPFFKTYIDIYRSDNSIPPEYRFSQDFEKMVDEWKASFEKTWNEETRKYFLVPIVDFGEHISDIKAKFKGEIVYPSLNTLFNTYAYYLKSENKLNQGLEVLLTGIELYPDDANLYDSAGEFYLAKEDKLKAIEYYLKALKIDPDFRSPIQALEKLAEKHTLDYLIKHTRVKTKK